VTTTDVFSTTVKAMSTFVMVPLAGEVVRMDTWRNEVDLYLNHDEQAAQALLAWLWWMLGATLWHRHSATNDKIFVHVRGSLDGADWDLWTTFQGDDMAVLCDHVDDEGPLSVHRLRKLQMRQTAALVAAR
jgi:hypothetical protein